MYLTPPNVMSVVIGPAMWPSRCAGFQLIASSSSRASHFLVAATIVAFGGHDQPRGMLLPVDLVGTRESRRELAFLFVPLLVDLVDFGCFPPCLVVGFAVGLV